MNNLVAFYLLKCLWPCMPSGPSPKRQRQDATATTVAALASPGAQGSSDLPTWHGGETVLGMAMDGVGAEAGAATGAPGDPGFGDGSIWPTALLALAVVVPPVQFVLVGWADVPAEWQARGEGASVVFVLPDFGDTGSYARWFSQTNADARITCTIDVNYERSYGLNAAVECLQTLNRTGMPSLRFIQVWRCSAPNCGCQQWGIMVQHLRR